MYIKFNKHWKLWVVYNNQDKVVASFKQFYEADRYLEQ